MEYVLGKNKYNENCTYHYIPILKSIIVLINNHSVGKHLETPLATKNKMFSNFTDGTVYTTNNFYQPDTLKVLLY